MKACTADQMRAIDRRAADEFGMPSLLLMENAGRAVAERACALLRAQSGKRVRVLCGKGNNGGDGFVAARHLANHGVPVECVLAGQSDEVRGDARVNLELLDRLGVPVLQFVPGSITELDADLLIDALLGTGFRGTPRGPVGDAIAAVNASALPVVAVDMPSGLDADAGTAGHCVRATETVTFGLPKLGLLTEEGRRYAGRLTIANISLPRPLLEDGMLRAEWITARRVRPLWPARDPAAHKADAGKLFVLAGAPGLTGAAAMCCEAALRAGAGLVTLGIPDSLYPILAAKLTEAMALPLPAADGHHVPAALETIWERVRSSGALAAGPGFGRDPRSGELLRQLFADCPAPAVVDADGLNLLAPAGGGTFPANGVITPHPLEMARLLGTEVKSIQSNRIETAREAAGRFGCVVVLKGPATVIAAPDGRLGVNSSGGPALATGGTGDVLTGILGAALARGLEPYEAAVASVFLHGLAGEVAGEQFGAPGTLASDVIRSIPEALRRLRHDEVGEPALQV